MTTAQMNTFENACNAREAARQLYDELSAITNIGVVATLSSRDLYETCNRALRISKNITATLESAIKPTG